MPALLDTLHNDHKNYAVLLNLLNAEADKLEQGEEADFVRMYDIANYMVNYPDTYHHPHEELIFDVLGALEPECSADIRELNKEHKQLAATGLALKDAVNGVINGAIIPMDRILDNARAYIELLWKHMNMEEGNIFPKARSTLEDTEWQMINDNISQVEDPLFGNVVQTQFEKLYEGIIRSSDSPTAGSP
ncbi:MAG: hemerythrin domain-containing protein [Gammaproteobacteria bacterium]|nr:hemerythrin domain-containing protein [Gammaproteobacteria bacterium]